MPVKLTCPRCGHSWNYTGTLIMANCPSCGKKVRVGRKKVNAKMVKK